MKLDFAQFFTSIFNIILEDEVKEISEEEDWQFVTIGDQVNCSNKKYGINSIFIVGKILSKALVLKQQDLRRKLLLVRCWSAMQKN